MKILAIETSCDDTAVAIVKNGQTVLSSVVSSQIALHSKFGGVVPEVAARAHLQNIIPVLEEALATASVKINEIDCFAVTQGPGLIGSLIVGVNTARVLALINKKPLVALHHTEGHIYANWLEKPPGTEPEFPLLCLTVSGGHSNLIYMKKHLDYQIIGQTRDDSVGEAFDKVAKMLDLGYPGGPIIAKSALTGNGAAFNFPRVDLTSQPTRDDNGFLKQPLESLDFSFSGLKTAVLREVRRLESKKALSVNQINDIAASFQVCANEILVRNTLRAVKVFGVKTVLLSGGVAANIQLRKMLKESLDNLGGLNYFYPEAKYCTDNAAMIGAVGDKHARKGNFTDPSSLIPDASLRLLSAS